MRISQLMCTRYGHLGPKIYKGDKTFACIFPGSFGISEFGIFQIIWNIIFKLLFQMLFEIQII